MNILEIIGKKRDKKELTKEEIEYFIQKYTSGEITDYQAAALVMAIYINGMTIEETTNLTLAMAHSGDILDLSAVGNVVDKHSTGGVGDKVTLILMPICASLGCKVAKMSGRGLGVTGGTKDKLEAIPGYRTEISIEEFIQNVNKIGISLIGQTLNLAPADKKLYALRDSINCTANIPLIASSIMSKKIASGANKLVLDVTCGSGAFMQNIKEAEELSKTMIDIGKLANKETVCVITNMDQPLGKMVGNTLEVIEAIEALKGNMEPDVKNVVLELGAYILKLDRKGDNIEQNKELITQAIENGTAYNKFIELIANQGGDISYIQNYDKFEKSKYKLEVKANTSGNIQTLNAYKVGQIASLLGAGRQRKEDEIDYSVGIELLKKVGDKVQEQETLAYIYANSKEKGKQAVEDLQKAYCTSEQSVEKPKDILEIMA